ncbi:hypothetical protein DP144_10025 [Clostridium tetani]|uniref:hypothetical protein n=1 Tax=Clostridium tetani TaxID=1513 RepID=UPI00100BE60D|nr:hypothetical protein [Clostridium tetani]RXM75330.1 hypothetical protein DP154_10020 [Clostridium tetani]RYU98644.1 hypothetical protein DP144_10025 [Clostridium tetani]
MNEFKGKLNLFISLLQINMETNNIAMGFNEKTKRLVLVDIDTNMTAEIDLKNLNRVVHGTRIF